MADAEERKRAKEAYLRALEEQRKQSATALATSVNATTGNNSTLSLSGQTAAQKREAQLEERRRKFFENATKSTTEIKSPLKDALSFPVNNFAPVQSSVNKPKLPEPKEAIRPSDWKAKGYASEFAYMKAMGQLDIAPKPLVDLTSWGQSSAANEQFNSHASRGALDSQIFDSSHLEGGKHQIHAEYAGQQKEQASRQQSIAPSKPPNGDWNKNNNPESQFNVGILDNKYNQGQKQPGFVAPDKKKTETRTQFQQQDTFTGAGNLNIGGGDDKETKRQKQAEYARALDQQAHMHAPTDSRQHQQGGRQHVHHDAYDPMNGGGNLNIGGGDDKETKRQKQAEYARALDQQAHMHAPTDSRQHQQGGRQHVHHDAYDPMNGGGNLNIGGGDDKETKRRKQAEYARALDQQAQQLVRMGDRAMYGGFDRGDRVAVDFIGGGADPRSDVERKRQKQEEYTRQLNLQAQMQGPAKLNKFGEYEYPGQHSNPPVNLGARVADISSIGVGGDDRAERRAKQAEYALALQQQQFLQQVQQPKGSRYQERDVAAASAPVGFKPTGGLEEGWVIGPLGLPVRKTLEVGNRKVQKAYVNHALQSQSPKKSPAGFNGPFGSAINQYQANGMYLNSPPHQNYSQYGGEPAGNMFEDPAFAAAQLNPPITSGDAIGGDPDERAMRIKQQQADQARVLEMQIRANKQRKEEEKRKLEEEELREIQKWEKQQAEIKKAMQLEEQQKKQKIDDDNRRILEQQMEQKRLEKEKEAENERLRAEREEARVRAEQEELRRKEELEIEREAVAAEKERQKQRVQIEEEERQRNLQKSAGMKQRANLFVQQPSVSPRPTSQSKHNLLEEQQQQQHNVQPWNRNSPIFGQRSNNGDHSQSRGQSGVEQKSGEGVRSASGSRNNKHLFEAAESDEELFVPPISKRFQAPQSPHKQKVEQFLSNRITGEKNQLHHKQNCEEQRHHSLRIQGDHCNPFDEKKELHPPPSLMLNLSNLKRGISAGVGSARGAITSARTSSRGRSRGTGRAGEELAKDCNDHDSSSTTISRNAPSAHFHAEGALQYRTSHQQYDRFGLKDDEPGQFTAVHSTIAREENQYQPPSGREDFALRSPSKTLKFESKFMLPDGTFMQSTSKPVSPSLWNQLSVQQGPAVHLGIQSVLNPPQNNHSDNRVNSVGSSTAVASLISPSKDHQDSGNMISPQSESTRGLIDDFNGTLQLLQLDENMAQRRAQLSSSKRPSTSGSTTSDFDLDRVNRRNERKWKVLKIMNGQHDDPEDDILFRGMQDIHSRPSTATSILPTASGNGVHDGSFYSYGRQQGGRLQGTAASSRPGSAEFARQLMKLNGMGGDEKTVAKLPIAPSPALHQTHNHGYGERPRSGGRVSKTAMRGAAVVGRSNNERYLEMHASVDDVDIDNYSDYGL